jgi:hypothetical protein
MVSRIGLISKAVPYLYVHGIQSRSTDARTGPTKGSVIRALESPEKEAAFYRNRAVLATFAAVVSGQRLTIVHISTKSHKPL